MKLFRSKHHSILFWVKHWLCRRLALSCCYGSHCIKGLLYMWIRHLWPLTRKRTLTAFRFRTEICSQAVSHPFRKEVYSFKRPCHPSTKIAHLFEQLLHPARKICIRSQKSSIRLSSLCHPFRKIVYLFKRLWHPFRKNLNPFEPLGHPFRKIIHLFKTSISWNRSFKRLGS